MLLHIKNCRIYYYYYLCDLLNTQCAKQEAQLSLTNHMMLVCKVVEVWQDFFSEYLDKKFSYICYRRLIRHK